MDHKLHSARERLMTIICRMTVTMIGMEQCQAASWKQQGGAPRVWSVAVSLNQDPSIKSVERHTT